MLQKDSSQSEHAALGFSVECITNIFSALKNGSRRDMSKNNYSGATPSETTGISGAFTNDVEYTIVEPQNAGNSSMQSS